MAIELCTDNSSRGISPRISFSHDLKNSDIVPIEPHIPLKSSLHDYDFDFCINRRSSYDQESSSLADELFANGIILPIQIKRKNLPTKSKSLLPPLPPSSVTNNAETESTRETEEKQGRSFWKFKRSKSLNCGSIYRRGFCAFPLLSRSKSTGSTASNAKGSLISKDEAQNHSYNNYHGIGGFKQSSQKNLYSSHNQRPPLKRNYGSSFNSGVVQASPVLNVPIAKLLGFGAIFSNVKDKGRKK